MVFCIGPTDHTIEGKIFVGRIEMKMRTNNMLFFNIAVFLYRFLCFFYIAEFLLFIFHCGEIKLNNTLINK